MAISAIKTTTRTIYKLTSGIILIVALIIVLSTATYAWYSTSNFLTASDVMFTASSKDASNTLSIGWDPDERETSISFANISGSGIHPMIPKYNGILGTTTYNQFINFCNATSSFVKEITSVTDTNPATLTNPTNNKNTFYLINGQNEPLSVLLGYNISYILKDGDSYDEEDNHYLDSYKCALFASDSESDIQKLIGILSTDSTIHYGNLEIGQSVENTSVMLDGIYKESGQLVIIVPASSYLKMKAVVWFDGVNMLDTDQNKTISFSMNFTA